MNGENVGKQAGVLGVLKTTALAFKEAMIHGAERTIHIADIFPQHQNTILKLVLVSVLIAIFPIESLDP
jgi:hypothetical protein